MELKFLRSLQSYLDGAFRKLIYVCDYQHQKKDWSSADAFVLPVLPLELIFLYAEIFRCERSELLAWLINIGHGLAGHVIESVTQLRAFSSNQEENQPRTQLELSEIASDIVAFPILQKVADHESAIKRINDNTVNVHYHRRLGVGNSGEYH